MKALLIYPELPVLFWTFEKLCRLAGAKSLVPPLGLITAASLLPPEWDLRLVDMNTRPLTESDWNWADMVLFSAMLPQHGRLFELLREAKAREKTTVAGGPFPSSAPREILDAGCDFLVRGEGENTVPLFLSAFREGKTRGVFESTVRPDLAQTPIPRYDLLRLKDYVAIPVQTSRGCPFDCEFCDIVNLYGHTPRYKTPDQVIGELEALYRVGWRSEVFISDDNFIGSKLHARNILEKLTPWMKSRGEPFNFMTQVSSNLGQDREMIDLMTEANFWSVFVGVESPDETVLALNRKYQNIRNPISQSLDNLNRNGLSVLASFIIGLDGEEKGAGQRICAFVEHAAIPLVMLNTLYAMPNTRLWKRLKREGRLRCSQFSDETVIDRLNYLPSRPESEIMQEYADAWEYLFEPSRYLARTYRYYLNMRPTRRALARQKGEPLPQEVPDAKQGLRRRLRDLYKFLRLAWWEGVLSPCRNQFWRQLIGMRRHNPSRLVAYLSACAWGSIMFSFRDEIARRRRVGRDNGPAETE
ncbi:MAG: B12-binding domain-containing radical SAM protein, partial [Deltaproteobacteria bacterium]